LLPLAEKSVYYNQSRWHRGLAGWVWGRWDAQWRSNL